MKLAALVATAALLAIPGLQLESRQCTSSAPTLKAGEHALATVGAARRGVHVPDRLEVVALASTAPSITRANHSVDTTTYARGARSTIAIHGPSSRGPPSG